MVSRELGSADLSRARSVAVSYKHTLPIESACHIWCDVLIRHHCERLLYFILNSTRAISLHRQIVRSTRQILRLRELGGHKFAANIHRHREYLPRRIPATEKWPKYSYLL